MIKGNRGLRTVWKGKTTVLSVGFVVCLLIIFQGRNASFNNKSSLLGITSSESTVYERAHGFFPLVLAPLPPSDGNVTTHINLPENNDGIFDENACNTWQHTADTGPYKKFNCRLEWDEWMLVNALIHEGDVVMEYGARYGTTSCVISRAVGKSGHVVSIEVDPDVHGYLLLNRELHKCNYHAVLGTVSTETMYMGGSAGYALFTSPEKKNARSVPIPRIELPTIEGILQRKFNVALIDCEGCIDSVEANGMFDQENGVDLILMEEDRPEGVNYTNWYKKFVELGYKCIWYSEDQAFKAYLKHSAWIHKRTEGKRSFKTCSQFAEENGYHQKQLKCLELPI